MKKELNLSIVVPIRNMSGRLENLTKSLLPAFSFGAEVILVLDGCIDETYSEIKSIFSDNLQKIIFVETSGIGPGRARNEGAKYITRDWVVFWDSDDVGSVENVAKVIAQDSEFRADMYIGRYYKSNLGESLAGEKWRNKSEDKNLKATCLNPGIWRMVFRSSLISKIDFGSSKLGEDQVFLARIFAEKPKISFTDHFCYIYYSDIENQLTSKSINGDELYISIQEVGESISGNLSKYSKYQILLQLKMFWTHYQSMRETRTNQYSRIKLLLSFLRANKEVLFLYIPAFAYLFSTLQSRKRVNYIHLTGGLGNQLFQLAAIREMTTNRKIYVDVANGKPRGDNQGIPDSLHYDYKSAGMHIFEKEFSNITRKGLGFCLRQNLKVNPGFLIVSVTKSAEFVTSILLSINLRKPIIIKVCRGIGFDSQISEGYLSTYFLGYFQSYRWLAQDPESCFEFPKIRNQTEEFRKYSEIARQEIPLVVHMRLGDYLLEDGFGTPTVKYYELAIKRACSEFGYKKIWLFSDDPQLALTRLPDNLPIGIRVMPNFGNSPIITLEVMRLGRGYIIANSTFSWWGAKLSHIADAKVICPYPWFKSLDTPADLLPENWLRMKPTE